jgi:hypothetical protein
MSLAAKQQLLQLLNIVAMCCRENESSFAGLAQHPPCMAYGNYMRLEHTQAHVSSTTMWVEYPP